MSQPSPMDEARGRGRPSHKPTAESRERVATLAGSGWRHADIAEAMGLARETLEKHYEHELSYGAHLKRAAVVEALYSAALKGNVSAARAYMQVEPQLAAPPLPSEGASEGVQEGEEMGKKERQAAEAKTAAAGTDWGDLLRDGGEGKVVPIR